MVRVHCLQQNGYPYSTDLCMTDSVDLSYCLSQNTSLKKLSYVIGKGTELVLRDRFNGNLPTLQQLLDLQQNEIDVLDTTDPIKHRVHSLKLLATRLAPNAQKIDTIRAICTCPLTLQVVNHGIMVACCGAVFEKTELFSYMGAMMQKQCPLCRRVLTMSQILHSAPRTAVDRIVELL